jgi:hypothetical protein
MSEGHWDLLERVFSDCHVVDVDLSEWDRRVGLLVVADHVESDEWGRNAPLLVSFVRVHDLRVKFNHLDIELDDPTVHFQWQVDTMIDKTEKGERTRRLLISGLKATPTLEIEFERVEIEHLSCSDMDRRLPGWTDPSGPFARPGVLQMLRGRIRPGIR